MKSLCLCYAREKIKNIELCRFSSLLPLSPTHSIVDDNNWQWNEARKLTWQYHLTSSTVFARTVTLTKLQWKKFVLCLVSDEKLWDSFELRIIALIVMLLKFHETFFFVWVSDVSLRLLSNVTHARVCTCNLIQCHFVNLMSISLSHTHKFNFYI